MTPNVTYRAVYISRPWREVRSVHVLNPCYKHGSHVTTWDLTLQTWDLTLQTWDLALQTWDLTLQTWGPTIQTWVLNVLVT